MIKGKLTGGDVTFNILNYLLFGIFTIICVFPFYYIFINTISSNELVTKGRILFMPVGVHINNYIHAFKIKGLPNAAFVSILRTAIGTAVVIIASSFPGYALSKTEFWHRKFWYRFVIATMYFSAGIIPVYITYKNLGLINNFWVYILPGMVSPFNLILCKTYIESIPASLEESAEIDGAGYLTKYFKIILPLAKPIIATIAIFSAVHHWNSFMDTVLYTSKSRLFTLQYILYLFQNEVNALAEIMRSDPTAGQNMDPSTMLTPTAVRFTVTMITVLPILMVYPFFQKYILKGIMIGAVKG
ncbi:MAG: putative aldouronate transport system permease protein [Clostridiales bacterium]|jgi:ABC-type glycerol-3-phosphate transport system permease component|nr:carbohydrate ABC transporter permease [Eubacteriales bacterium]MDD3198343.1 carbohydrate ABC transporter permease [Eubacteriales bacterium]MDD3503394.1 carbohydrate ABC transporter permease [Eubacteriales bacterium]MDD4683168.1 carbohydrate ABC transporter permease [Eubacteriales bacterium]MDN5314462.1 putative aldouronate transport system permease protein [Clostridiales bacterium]